MKKAPYLTDIQEIQRRAREAVERGSRTPSYPAKLDNAIGILNQALATELVCVLRYRAHYFAADGIHSREIAAEFLEHANDEQVHADQLALRIKELGGAADFNPEGLLSRSHSEFHEGTDLVDRVREDLIAERIAIDTYREMISYFDQTGDPTTRRLLEDILAKEEEHAEDLTSLLADFREAG